MDAWRGDAPIYRQIKARVVRDILTGKVAEGAALDSVRTVASFLQVNPLTVARAYQELAEEGHLDKQRGMPMTVAKGARARLLTQERERFLREEWPAIQEKIRLLGVSSDWLLSPEGSGAQK